MSGSISWDDHKDLRRKVDLTWVLKSAAAVEETWPDQKTATKAVMKDFGITKEKTARNRVSYAIRKGQLLTNGQRSQRMRFEPGALAAWRLAMRDRDLDAEDPCCEGEETEAA